MKPAALIPLILALALAGCAGAPERTGGAGDDADSKSDHTPVESLLVVDGRRHSADAPVATEPAREPRTTVPRGPVLASLADLAPEDPWPALTLLADGTIDASSEPPFTDQPLEVQRTPIEDDPDSTSAIDGWSSGLRRIDSAEWARRSSNGTNSPWARRPDPTMAHVVRIAVQRCGGARTVATGAVVAEDTVVTTVHAIESTSLRVRVSPALGEPRFIPAMVRYLDVDDDVAVLRVPGLGLEPIDLHVPDQPDPEWGYAYGVSNGGPGGVIQRSPAIVAMQESTIDVEQPDGFAWQITDRNVFGMVAAVDAGFSGGLVTATNAAAGTSGWELHGLVRARMPLRSLNAGIVVPARIVGAALSASRGLPPWFEHRPGGCPQWYR